MRPIVPHDTGAWWTTDRETLLPTVLGVSEPPAYFGDLFSPADFDVFDRLDQTSRDTAIEPHILRVLSRSGHATWAAGRFTRAPDLPRFTKAEAGYLAAVGRYVGAGVREISPRHLGAMDPPGCRACLWCLRTSASTMRPPRQASGCRACPLTSLVCCLLRCEALCARAGQNVLGGPY